MPVADHLIAHTRMGNKTLTDPSRAPVVWDALRTALPQALGTSLLPDHIHSANAPGQERAFRRGLRRIERAFPDVRFDLLPTEPAHSPAIAARIVRYILRNPVQHGLVSDPFLWPWTTLLDLAGAVAEPWVTPRRLAMALQRPPRSLPGFLLQIEGRSVPPLERELKGFARLSECRDAVARAFRLHPADVAARLQSRRTLVHLADTTGRWRATDLAAELACSSRTVERDRASDPPSALTAAKLCLADPRLHRFPSPPDLAAFPTDRTW